MQIRGMVGGEQLQGNFFKNYRILDFGEGSVANKAGATRKK